MTNRQEEPGETFAKGELEAFLAGLRTSASESAPVSDPQGAAKFAEALRLFKAADDMDKEGPKANTPLSAILHQDLITSAIVAVMMSPIHTDWDKARLIAALTIVGLKEYNIAL